ncbi:unnamed protein product [Clonostachys byssicola]|uniref:Protein kinase domain-containing protein n=1 Tax=Clonostachys byssicola TaxID=160290 RepID=A0A9N9XZ30_9HYPO|nr:unnamed protein product [Clonostachys byssicola]
MAPPLGSLPTPPDPRRPPLPYHSGASFTIRPHQPPVPFGAGYFTEPPARERFTSLDFWAGVKSPQTDWCLRERPLIETPPADGQPHVFHILSQIVCRDGRGPQVVRCYLDECRAKTYVAKIFDPLYYQYPGDVTWSADHDYSLESSAYTEIQNSSLDGQFTPRYHGSFTFTLPLLDTPQSTGLTYPARLVLMEDVQGVSMETLMTNDLYLKIPLALRLDITAQILETDCRLRFIGVMQNDLAPRNVMLSMDPDDLASPPSRTVLLDFSYSHVVTWKNSKNQSLLQPRGSLPKGPICFHWDQGSPRDFGPWVPPPIGRFGETEAWNDWLLERWGDSDAWAGRETLTDLSLCKPNM